MRLYMLYMPYVTDSGVSPSYAIDCFLGKIPAMNLRPECEFAVLPVHIEGTNLTTDHDNHVEGSYQEHAHYFEGWFGFYQSHTCTTLPSLDSHECTLMSRTPSTISTPTNV